MTMEPIDVFVSWTSADRDVKNVLVDKLQQRGLSCWESDEYCTSDFSEECADAIRRSRVFIVIVSDSSMGRGYVKNETIIAREQEDQGLLNILVYRVTDKPYTGKFQTLLNHISFIPGNVFCRTDTYGRSPLDRLVDRAVRLLELRAHGTPEDYRNILNPRIEGLEIHGTGYYVPNSRNTELARLEEALSSSRVVILKGLFGSGRQTLVRQYVQRHRRQLNRAVIVKQSQNSLEDFFLSGLQYSNLDKVFDDLEGKQLLKRKLQVLEYLRQDSLLVISDARIQAGVDDAILQHLLSLKCGVILLTQQAPGNLQDWIPTIPVEAMDSTHLTELFFHHYPHATKEEQLSLAPALETFFQRIGGHPQTITLTANALAQKTDVFPDQIAGFLLAEHRGGLALQDRIREHISRVLDQEQFSQVEENILLATALLASPEVSQVQLKSVLARCDIDSWDTVNNLHSRNWLQVDVRNRCVTMDPVIAKLILHRFSDNYRVKAFCLQGLEVNTLSMKIAATHKTLTGSFCTAEQFFQNAQLPEISALFRCYMSVLIDPCQESREALRQALERYQDVYRDYIAELESDSAFTEDASDYKNFDFPEEAENSGWPDTPPLAFSPEPVYDREQFLQEVISYVHPYLIPPIKLQLSRFYEWTMDLSPSNPLLAQLNPEELLGQAFGESFGLNSGEITAVLEIIHSLSREEYLDLMEEQDEDTVSYLLWVESLHIFQCFFRRDYTAMLLGMDRILDLLAECPEPEDETDINFALVSFFMLASAYLNSGACHQALRLCEKVLPFTENTAIRNQFLTLYIRVLQESRQFDVRLFDAYREILDNFDAKFADLYSTHTEMRTEQKEYTLCYATALLRGGHAKDAQKQFTKAQALGKSLLPKETLQVAGHIVEALSLDDFSKVVPFLASHFSPEQLADLEKHQDPDISGPAWEFRCYLDSRQAQPTTFEQNADPLEYRDYYQDYSRKNSASLEAVYQQAARKAESLHFGELSNEELAAAAQALRTKAKKKKKVLDLAPEALALAGEAGFRVLGYRPHRTQYLGAVAMADGKIAEIYNGEGKTYTIALTAFLQSLYHRQIFVVDESQHLTRRNHGWMHGMFQLLGMESGLILDSHDVEQRPLPPVVYIDLKSLIIGVLSAEQDSTFCSKQINLDCAILDEADCILVDQANTPFIVAKWGERDPSLVPHRRIFSLAKEIAGDDDYYTYENQQITLLPPALEEISRRFGVSYENVMDLSQIQMLETQLKTALVCFHYEEGVDFYIHRDQFVYENSTTGLFVPFSAHHPDRNFYLCAFHGMSTSHAEDALYRQRIPINQVSLRDFFRRFQVLCGTTATAVSFRKEFEEIYELKYFSVPFYLPFIRENHESPVYCSMWAKDRAIIEAVEARHAKKQPVLLITQSVEESQKYAKLLRNRKIPHRLLNAYNSDESSELLSTAGIPDSVLIATALANRGVDIKLGGNPELMARRELVLAGEDTAELDKLIYALPSREQQENSLYRKYINLLEKHRIQAAALRQEVIAAGGLCVIGTSFFPEPRTEQQARGRSGRQGEPGESWVFRSLEDPVLKSMVTPFLKNLILSNGTEDLALENIWVLRTALHNYQQRLHDNKFKDIRRNNSNCAALEPVRAVFVGSKDDLLSGELSPRDFLRIWFHRPETLEDLSRLKKGQIPAARFLGQLYEKHSPLPPSIKNTKTADSLMAHYWEDLLEKDGFSEDVLRKLLPYMLSLHWQEYVEAAQNLDQLAQLSSADREAELKKLEYSLLTRCVEKLYLARIRPKRRRPNNKQPRESTIQYQTASIQNHNHT